MKTKKKFISKDALVIYDNKIQRINFSNLTILENNILFDIFSKLRFKKTYTFTIDELKRMSNAPLNTQNTEIKEVVERLTKNLLSMYIIDGSKQFVDTYMNIFSHFDIRYTDAEKTNIECLYIQLNNMAYTVFKNLTKDFTEFDLSKFKKLNSKYTQAIYRFLSSNSYKGVFEMDYYKFRILLGIPESYDYKQINQNILTPSCNKIKDTFKGLNWHLEKKRNKKTNKLEPDKIVFQFQKFSYSTNELFNKDNYSKTASKEECILAAAKNISRNRANTALQNGYEKSFDSWNTLADSIDIQLDRMKGKI